MHRIEHEMVVSVLKGWYKDVRVKWMKIKSLPSVGWGYSNRFRNMEAVNVMAKRNMFNLFSFLQWCWKLQRIEK